MKYMLITNGSQQDYDGMGGKATDKPAWTAEEFNAMVAFMTAFNKSLEESGELVETRGLAGPVHTRRVTGLKDGVPVVTDGPYAETQEVLAGYWIVECDGIDRAIQIAGELTKCPGPAHVLAGNPYIDVRPLQEAAGDML